jgi:DGQHR domain-containing protein
MIKTPYIEINQPIGSFYFTKFNASDLVKIVEVTPRSADPNAIQRDDSKSRISEIADYCSDPDATFPTPIIVSVNDNVLIEDIDNHFIIDPQEIIGEVIDGQHRLKGILQSDHIEKFELAVVLMFNLTEEEKAYVFSIINSKQTKVSMSLIYDLFALSKNRSPQKTAHEIARTLNKSNESPFHNRLKMLGKRNENQDLATLSQGTFVKYIMRLFSKKPDLDLLKLKRNETLENKSNLPLRDYFIQGEDQIILKILLNLFNALKEVFPQHWGNPYNNILWKTTGYGGIIKSFDSLYKLGDEKNDLSKTHFIKCFKAFESTLKNNGIELTSEYFPSNEQQQTKLSKLLIESLNTAYNTV